MKKILILFAHPAIHKSRINRKLVETVKNINGVTLNDLYENYPDFFIDVKRERKLLVEHDVIVWQHPFYWYSSPAILKEWMDLVLEHGFAYGIEGRALENKQVLSVVTTGGRKEVYTAKGRNQYTLNQFMIPFKQSAKLCRMEYLPPFVVHGSHTMNNQNIEEYAETYKELLISLRDETLNSKKLSKSEYLNDLLS